MTKLRSLLALSVASVLLYDGYLEAAYTSSDETPENSQLDQSNRKTVKKAVKRVSDRKISPSKVSVAPPQACDPKSANNTPQWLRIDHNRLIHDKKGPQQEVLANNPFNHALASAYNCNPDLKAKLRQYYATSENISQALGGWRPTITGTAQAGYSLTERQNNVDTIDNNGNLISQRPGTSSQNPKSATLNVTQNLYRGGQTIATTKLAEDQIRSSRADLRNTEQTILLNAVQAYTTLWYQREKLVTIHTSEHFYKESLEQARAQADVGESSITDVAQAEFSYQKSVADRVAAQADLQNSEAAYIQVIGEAPPLNLILPRPLNETVDFPQVLTLLTEAAGKYNPLVIRAEFDESASKNDIDVATGALLPSVDLVGSADRILNTSRRHSRQNDASLGLRLTVPFYNNGGNDWSRLRQLEQVSAQRKHEVKSARNRAINDAKQAWDNLQSGRDQIKFYQAAVKAGNIRIEGTRQEYMVGERTLLEVLQAESDVVDAHLSLLNAQRNYIVSAYALAAAIGELTPETLKLDVQTYDLNTYPEAVRQKWIGWQEAPSDQRGKCR